MGALSDINRKYGSSYIWMSIYFCLVMIGIFLCEVVDALSNIRRCGETCIELCTLTYVVCFIKNVAQSYNIGKAQ